jgi:glycosyltransferase involved in cell wall biosynthesis
MLAHAEPGAAPVESQTIDRVDVTLTRCYGQVVHAPISPSFPFALQKSIRRFKPDLVHLHVPNTSAFWALLSPAARRIPWIIHWHADVPLDAARARLRFAYRVYRPWEQALLTRARSVIATSRAYCDASAALAPWNEKVAVIPLGLGKETTASAAALQSMSWPAQGLRVLAVGRLSYYKGFDVLLRAIASVPEVQLVLVGSGECDASLRKIAADLGIEKRVWFAGRVNDDDLAAAYATADVLCLPSTERSEAFGLVLLEAMRARLPTIASAIPGSGVSTVVADGETGLLVPPGDAEALAQALRRMAGDPDLRKRLGSAGERRWRANFTLERVADQTLALYRDVLKKIPHREAAEREK